MQKTLGIILELFENKEKYLTLLESSSKLLLPFGSRFLLIDYHLAVFDNSNIKEVITIPREAHQKVFSHILESWNDIFEPIVLKFVGTGFEFISTKPLNALIELPNTQENLQPTQITFSLSEYVKKNDFKTIIISLSTSIPWLSLKNLLEDESNENVVVYIEKEGKNPFPAFVKLSSNFFLSRFLPFLLMEFKTFSETTLLKFLNSNNFPSFTYKTPFSYYITDIKSYYETHLEIIKSLPLLEDYMALVPIRANHYKEATATIGKTGMVKNSIISDNSEVHGIVENSVIFPNVRIEKKAIIKNSIIFSGNWIGEGAKIINSIIDEYQDIQKKSPNIESKVKVGGEFVASPNVKYPNLLSPSLTVIGKNVRLPKHFSVGMNAFIPSNVDIENDKNYRHIRSVKDSTCLEVIQQSE